MEFSTLLLVLAVAVGILSTILLIGRLRSLTERDFTELRSAYRKVELVNKLRFLKKLKQRYLAAETWLRARKTEQIRALRLSQVPREIRILYEELDSLLNFFEASPYSDIEGDPELKEAFVKALIKTAALAVELENPASAIRRIRRALQEGENYAREIGEDLGFIYFILGTAYMLWGSQEKSADELQSAQEYLQRAVEESGDSDTRVLALFNLAWTLDEIARISRDSSPREKAVEILGKVIEDEPSDVGARYNLACALSLLGRYEEALKQLNEIPKGSDVWQLAKDDADFSGLRSEPKFRGQFQTLLGERITEEVPAHAEAGS